jgi:PIN domain nuclease of toxin-antitoxin system
MKLLLDTHIWLWYLLSDPSLSPSLQTTIVAPDTELWLSPITLWETLMLAEKGRINLQPNAGAWIVRALTILPTKEATLNHTIARLSRQLPIPHSDPADRFLAATATYYNLTLATVDHNLLKTPGLKTIR